MAIVWIGVQVLLAKLMMMNNASRKCNKSSEKAGMNDSRK